MVAIVLVGYNRVDSMRRLYNSVNRAYYPEGVEADLIFSVDHSDTNAVIEFAQQAEWTHGKKKIRAFEERQGLRKHILSCSVFFQEYEALIILEDDICVAEDYYHYALQAVEHYKNDSRIAGISLYAHSIYQSNLLRFSPMKSVYDTYFLQYAASWGQIWLRDQFADFLQWYEGVKDTDLQDVDMPDIVKCWPATSWLKFHIAYCVDRHKFFVYPYNALSTNYSDPGQHFYHTSNVYQVELQKGSKKTYSFSDPDSKNAVFYDSFFENLQLRTALSEYEDLCTDVTGIRKSIPDGCRYCLTTKKLNKKILRTYGLKLRPIEENVLEGVEGEGIYLYDMGTDEKNRTKTVPENLLWAYNCKGRSLPTKPVSYVIRRYLKR